MSSKNAYIYILTNSSDIVIYTGVTSNLQKRVFEHKEKLVEGFTKRYNVDKLVYYEVHDTIFYAIEREKNKGWIQKKENGVNKFYEA